MPPLSKHKQIHLFLEQVKKDLSIIDWNYKGLDNFTKAERKALKELQEAKDIIIKGSDKGGNTVLLSQALYEETMRLLQDETTYQRLPANPFPKIVASLNFKLNMALEEHLITLKECKYLSVNEFNIPTFYTIPKLHKSITRPPGRPIVSAIKGPLERIGKFVDALIKDLVCELPSFVHALKKLDVKRNM